MKRQEEPIREPLPKGQSTALSQSLHIKESSERPRWIEIIVRVWNKLFDDEVFGRAAQFAYYWLFSLFPLLLFLTSLLSFSPMSENLDRWLGLLSNILPPEAYLLIHNTFIEIIKKPRHGLISFSILIVIWASSSGMGSVITSLNRAFDAPEMRSWWKERLLAIWLTLGLTVFIIAALTLIFFGDEISLRIANAYGLGETFNTIGRLAQWPIMIIFVLVGLELIYYFAPNMRQKWELFTPGAIFALVFWLAISFGFRFYVSRFGNYDATYGALGGVMVLMLWLYLTGVAILVGGVINSVSRTNLKKEERQD